MDDITRLEDTGQAAPAARRDEALHAARRCAQARSGEAKITFSLAAAPTAPVKFEILDSANQVIRTFEAQARAGLNVATWDLRYEGPGVVELRTTPPDNPHIWDEQSLPRARHAAGRRTGASTARSARRRWPRRASTPVRMTVGGQPYTQPFEVDRRT